MSENARKTYQLTFPELELKMNEDFQAGAIIKVTGIGKVKLQAPLSWHKPEKSDDNLYKADCDANAEKVTGKQKVVVAKGSFFRL